MNNTNILEDNLNKIAATTTLILTITNVDDDDVMDSVNSSILAGLDRCLSTEEHKFNLATDVIPVETLATITEEILTIAKLALMCVAAQKGLDLSE